MITHELVQNTPAWAAHRAKYRNSSDTPCVMSDSPYKSRTQFMRERVTGISDDVDAGTQARFDNGHRFEKLALPLMEELVGEALYPVVGSEGAYSASFDGLTMGEDIATEHKTLNDEIRACQCAADLPPLYRDQMEIQLKVSGANKCLFMASIWDANDKLVEEKHFWYEPDLELRKRIDAAWIQFETDASAYVHQEVLPAAVAAPTLALPAVSIRVEGAVALIDNLAVFGEGLKDFIAQIPEKPSTDLEFVTCKAACAKLQEAQDALDAGEAHALGQIQSFDQMRRTKALLYDLARNTRLAVEKMVAAREQQIKYEIVQKAKAFYDAHVESLKAETGGPWIVISGPDFAGAVKNKRTVASLQNAVDTALANGKITADASAKLIRANLACLREGGAGFEFLFNDRLALISKPIDDLRILIKSRIADHKAVEAERLEAERQKIRDEEIAKIAREKDAEIDNLRREADAKLGAELKAAAAQTLVADTSSHQQAIVPVQSSVPAAAPIGKPKVSLTASGPRPTEASIVGVLAAHYRVDAETVIKWLRGMDWDAASKRIALEFAE